MKLLCLGDSIMQYNDWTTYPQTGWVQLLDRFFVPGFKILNFARNGRSTKSFIEEGRFDKVLQNAEKGDFAIIQFAHNDEKIQDSSRYTGPEKDGQFRKNLEFMVNELKKRGVNSILLTPVTRLIFDTELTIKNSHGDYPEAIKETAEKINIPCIDLTTLSVKYFESKGQHVSRRYFMNFGEGVYENFPDGKNDNSHLRADGAYVICRLFVSELLRLTEKWPSYAALADCLCTKGVYEDKEIDDEILMW